MRGITTALALLVVLLGLLVWWWSDPTAPVAAPKPGDAPRAAAPGEATGGADPTPAPTDDSERQAVEASAATADAPPTPSPEELWGRVVEAGSHAPIAGADVTLQHRDADEFWNLDLDYGKRVTEAARTRTGADGSFRFPVSRAIHYRLVVSAGGFAKRALSGIVGGGEVVVEMCFGATVEGIVRCDGKGLGDVAVTISDRGENTLLAEGRTHVDGTFLFRDLQPAAVSVQAGSPDHRVRGQRLTLAAGQTHRAEIDLDAGLTLRGRVVDDTTGTPVAGAEASDSWTFRRKARTDTDGRFALRGIVDDGFVCIEVRAPGFATAFLNLTGKIEEEAEFRLVRGGEVTGRVLDGTGRRVPDAYAAIAASYMQSGGMQGCDWIPAELGPDGRFVARGLRPTLHYWLYVRAPGHGTRVHALPRVLENGERVDLGDVVLLAAGGIEGRLVDDAGEPFADHAVSVRGTNADSQAWLDRGTRPKGVTQFESRSTATNARGVFRFTSLSAGSYVISVRQRDGADPVTSQVTVVDGEITAGVEIVMARGIVIRGTLRYADGRALGDAAANLYLAASGEGLDRHTAHVQADGTFMFRGVKDGSYAISMDDCPQGWSLATKLDVPAGTDGLDLVLEPAATITGRVLGLDGNPTKAHIWVRAHGYGGSAILQPTDDEGRFRIEVAPSFRGQLAAHDLSDFMVQAMLEDVTAGQTDLTLTLQRKPHPIPGRR